jgi:hypothetical protein
MGSFCQKHGRGRKTRKISSPKGHLVLLSESDIKTSVVRRVFGRKCILHFVKVPDNPERPTQPLFIEGTKEACSTRFDEYFSSYKRNDLPETTNVISIENGILALDMEKEGEFKDLHWADFCVIGITSHQFPDIREFVISPEIIAIDTKYTKEYFEDGRTHSEFETLGKLIVSRYLKEIPDNNWMKYVANIDRKYQIHKGLCLVHLKP